MAVAGLFEEHVNSLLTCLRVATVLVFGPGQGEMWTLGLFIVVVVGGFGGGAGNLDSTAAAAASADCLHQCGHFGKV